MTTRKVNLQFHTNNLDKKKITTHSVHNKKGSSCGSYKGHTESCLCLETGEIHDDLDEDGVITYVGVFTVQFRERTEEWATAGNIHVTDRPLKGRGGDVGPESINYVLPVVLVKQH